MRSLDRACELERPLVVEREEVVRHPDVVIAELGDLAHLGHDGFDGARAEQVAEDRLVAEVTAKRTSPRRHQWRRRVLPVLSPVTDVIVIGDVTAVGQRQVRHVLAALPGDALDHRAVSLEDNARDLFEAPVIEVLHDRHDRLLALTHSDQVEEVHKGLGFTGRVGPADHGQRLAPHLLGEGQRLVLHRDHAVDADHRRLQAFDLLEDLTALEERVVDVADRIAGLAQRCAQIHQAQGRHDPVASLPRCALRVDQHDIGSLSHLASCTLM